MTVDVRHDPIALAACPPEIAALRVSPLGHRAADLRAASAGPVRLAELAFLTQLALRVDPGADTARRVEQALGVHLPGPGRVTGEEVAVSWIGPDEFLVVARDGAAAGLLRDLGEALAGRPGTVVDLSANRTTVLVAGPAARDVLAKGVSVDLHPRAFTPGTVAATLVARTQVILRQVSDEPEYRLAVRASFAGYLADWLIDAAYEFGG